MCSTTTTGIKLSSGSNDDRSSWKCIVVLKGCLFIYYSGENCWKKEGKKVTSERLKANYNREGFSFLFCCSPWAKFNYRYSTMKSIWNTLFLCLLKQGPFSSLTHSMHTFPQNGLYQNIPVTPIQVQSMHHLPRWLSIAHYPSGVCNTMLIILNAILSQ